MAGTPRHPFRASAFQRHHAQLRQFSPHLIWSLESPLRHTNKYGTNRDMLTHIQVRGAREHNLKGVDVDLPKNRLTVITGLSGSGKSSLAFDTIYAEGQRRYVESLSAYA